MKGKKNKNYPATYMPEKTANHEHHHHEEFFLFINKFIKRKPQSYDIYNKKITYIESQEIYQS